MKNNKTCLDCLFCKVSAKSTANCRLCFCSMSKKKERHKEPYWLTKKPCDDFEDMTEISTPKIIYPKFQRRPLLSVRENNERYGY